RGRRRREPVSERRAQLRVAQSRALGAYSKEPQRRRRSGHDAILRQSEGVHDHLREVDPGQDLRTAGVKRSRRTSVDELDDDTGEARCVGRRDELVGRNDERAARAQPVDELEYEVLAVGLRTEYPRYAKDEVPLGLTCQLREADL